MLAACLAGPFGVDAMADSAEPLVVVLSEPIPAQLPDPHRYWRGSLNSIYSGVFEGLVEIGPDGEPVGQEVFRGVSRRR
ncbi:MAG: hypothetical protein AAGM22_18990 [Acidobacteriota bacterium]